MGKRYPLWHPSSYDARAAILARVIKTDAGLNDFEETITINELMLLQRLGDANRKNEERLSPLRRPMVWRLTMRETKKLLCDAQRSKNDPDKYDCVICGQSYAEDEMDIDHRIPKSEGGADNITNYTLTCIPCNRLKGSDYTYTGARKELRRQGDRAIDVDAAKYALQNVDRMILLISHHEDIKREVIEPYNEWLHGQVPSIFGIDGKLIPLAGNDFLGSLRIASNAIAGYNLFGSSGLGNLPSAFGEFRNPYLTSMVTTTNFGWDNALQKIFTAPLDNALASMRGEIGSLINVLNAAIEIKSDEKATQCQTNPRASGSRTTQCRRRYRTRRMT